MILLGDDEGCKVHSALPGSYSPNPDKVFRIRLWCDVKFWMLPGLVYYRTGEWQAPRYTENGFTD